MPTSDSPTLSLAYAFLPTPNQILASVPGSNPYTVSLQVLVSLPSTTPVVVSHITIQIPTGQNTSMDISTALTLPQPVYPTGGTWTVSVASDTLTIKPASGNTITVTSPIIFTLPGIQINDTPGTVPLTITEFYPSPAPKVTDSTTYSVLKQPATFP